MTRTKLIMTRRPLQQLSASHASKLLQGSCQGNGERCLQRAHSFYIPYIRLNNDNQTALILSAKNYQAAIAKPLSVKLLPQKHKSVGARVIVPAKVQRVVHYITARTRGERRRKSKRRTIFLEKPIHHQ